MGLREYNRKRDFSKTKEPAGKHRLAKPARAHKSKPLSFTVQKHDASHLHYDFRLEMDGVLKSWAVPKGPSLDPSQKRLAMHVEDHPLDYGTFEGTIPEGEYGGGTVMLWDRGTWVPESDDPLRDYEAGSLKFKLIGKKLRGRWKLFRMKTAGEKAWLLMKASDEFSKPLAKGDVLKDEDLSVKTGRDLAAIGGAKKKVEWESAPKKGKAVVKKASPLKRAAPVKMAAPAKKSTIVKRKAPVAKPTGEIELSHPDKIYYPAEKVTKQDLYDYYMKVAPLMLEHVAGRPLMISRCPSGITSQCFFQKHWTKGLPAAIKKFSIKGEAEPYLTIEDADGLAAFAQFGVLEIHSWQTHLQHIDHPDQWIFDLDPDASVPWTKVCDTALDMRKRLAKLGLESFVKTTGGKGLHVVVPIEPKLKWDLSTKFTKAFSDDVAAANPSMYLTQMTKSKRKGKIFIDYLRNGRGATAVAPYSPRARKGATVSFPVSWADVKAGVRPDAFRIQNIDRFLKARPWKGFEEISQLPSVG